MIDCPNVEIRDRLPDFAHDRAAIPAEARAAVEAHLATCPACRDELSLLHAARRAHARVPAVDVASVVAALPRPDTSRVSAARSGRGGRGPRTLAWQRAAAIALVAVGFSSLWLAREVMTGDSREGGLDTILSGAEAPESPAMTLGYRLSELSEQDLEALLGALDDLEALPAVEPAPMIEPLGGQEGS